MIQYSRSLLLTFILFCTAGCGSCTTADERIYNEAQSLWLQNKFSDAIPKLMVIVERSKDPYLVTKSLVRLGEIYYLNYQEPERAIEFYQRAVQIGGSDHLTLKANIDIAQIYFLVMKNYDASILQYNKIINEFPDLISEEKYRFKIAEAYFAKGNYPQAEIEFYNILKEFPDTKLRPDILYQIGNGYYINGHTEKAVELFLQVVKEYPDSRYEFDSWLSIAISYEEQEKLEESFKIYQMLDEKFPAEGIILKKIESVKKRID
ncbi:MAG: tetratricopeptide repeat protein, partial [Nitrospinota bacterium]